MKGYCEHCKYAARVTVGYECRRHPPVLLVMSHDGEKTTDNGRVVTKFPTTSAMTFCGEYKRDTKKFSIHLKGECR